MWMMPPNDRDCFSEATLLACALIGADPIYIDSNLQLLEQYSRSAPADLAAVSEDRERGIESLSTHLRHVDRDGQVREGWAQVRADLSGRLHDTPPPEAGAWRTLDVDLTRTPARDRLAALAPRACRVADERLAQLQAFIGNAVAITAPGARPPLRGGLLTLVRELRLGELVRPGMDPLEVVAAQEQRLAGAVWEQRELGLVDGATAADALIAIMLAGTIAHTADPVTGVGLWARQLAYADAYITAGRPIAPLIEQAIRDGHHAIVEQLAEGFLDCGEQMRDTAMNQPTYDRGGFAKALYDTYPYLHAARTVAATLASITADEAHTRIHQVADEWAVRVVDGLFHQWLDLGNEGFDQERRTIAAAIADGDQRRVRRILLDGETALLRPKSARAQLLPATKGDT
ncbi:hypothetical protein ACFWPX_01015 [Nocardia sp. NPDC058518]|uniref:hypothetical protein n=1 Tax=Nocardia sp. NPDC058518 TaxID=3346534 RepID=UPI0036569070